MKNKAREVAEMLTLRHLMKQFPTGILSVVSDTFNLWDVLKKDGILAFLKDEILARDGKIVIRPDSGDPVDIICGHHIVTNIKELNHLIGKDNINIPQYYINKDGVYYEVELLNDRDNLIIEIFCEYSKEYSINRYEQKGVIELLWDLFGGIINEQGYKVLNPHIGAIYGDSITLERAKQITERLKDKDFASTNVVLGIGSYSYQYVTRDTHGFAMKATYVEVNGKGKNIFKDPVTGDGAKKSAKGLLSVWYEDQDNAELYTLNESTKEQEDSGELKVIFENGRFYNKITLTEIRNKISKQINKK